MGVDTKSLVHNDMYVKVVTYIPFRVPWFQWPIFYEIRARPKLLTSPTGSKDLQMVNIGLRVLYRPESDNLPSMYRQLGRDYDDRVLPSICNEVGVVKGVVCGLSSCVGIEGCSGSVQCVTVDHTTC